MRASNLLFKVNGGKAAGVNPGAGARNPIRMQILPQSELPFVGMSHEFRGREHENVGISFFLVSAESGRGTRLHQHDYDEVVYVMEGRSKWIVNGQEIDAKAGDTLVVRAGEPHAFMNCGEGILRQIDIHLNPTFETTWLEPSL